MRKLTPCPAHLITISSQNTLAKIQTKFCVLLHLEHFVLLLNNRGFLRRNDLASRSNDLSIQILRSQRILVIGQFGEDSLLRCISDVLVVVSLLPLAHLRHELHLTHRRMSRYLPESSQQKSSHYYHSMDMALVELSQVLLRRLLPYIRSRQIPEKSHHHIEIPVRR